MDTVYTSLCLVLLKHRLFLHITSLTLDSHEIPQCHNRNPDEYVAMDHMNYKHYSDFTMSAMTPQITGVSIIYLTVCSSAQKGNIKDLRHWPLWV